MDGAREATLQKIRPGVNFRKIVRSIELFNKYQNEVQLNKLLTQYQYTKEQNDLIELMKFTKVNYPKEYEDFMDKMRKK